MKPETLAKAKHMLQRVLAGATYREAGNDHGITRSTVERQVKALVRDVAREQGIPGLDDDGLASLVRLRRARVEVLAALRDYSPCPSKPAATLLGPDDTAAGASRVRTRSDNPARDVALIYVLFCTGAKPIEVARLEVRDYLNRDGQVRAHSEIRAEAAVRGRARPLFFTSARACAAVDAYLAERLKQHLGLGPPDDYRGLDPNSGLFLTETGHRFEVTARGPGDPRQTCRLIIATYRSIFSRAGWVGVNAQSVRRTVARRLAENGAHSEQVGQLLGLTSNRSVKRLLSSDRRPLDMLAEALV